MSTTKRILAVSALSVAYAYSGEGTFYGAGGAGEKGACLLQPGFNGVGITVAMNSARWENGLACGKCVIITGPNSKESAKGGRGLTPIVGLIYGTVDNLCPECAPGSVDLGLGGDGRWPIDWDFIRCNDARVQQSVLPKVQLIRANQTRQLLRGTSGEEESDVPPGILQPGYIVTPQGIRAVADVHQEQRLKRSGS